MVTQQQYSLRRSKKQIVLKLEKYGIISKRCYTIFYIVLIYVIIGGIVMDSKAMFKLSYGLFVVTAKEDEKNNGCIVNTVMQVTSEPNRISVTVNKANYTHDMIMRTGKLTVSVLSEDAGFGLFKRFGFQSGKDVDKFEGFDGYKKGMNDVAYITEGTNAYIHGQVVDKVDVGTHTIFICDVLDMDVLSDKASATYAYYHEHIKPKPESVKNETTGKNAWRCTICGYVHEDEELPADFICPLCKHPASDFEKIVL